MKTPSWLGWILLASFVWLWDAYADQSLSSGFSHGLERKFARFGVMFGTGWVLSHLFLKRPKRILVKW